MINVLWIDDQPNNAFVDRADKKGINIEVRKNVDDGILELCSSSVYDAIILDANCISHSNGSSETDISALAYALRKITEHKINTPWFVYSGGGFSGEESIDIIVRAFERDYDEKLWYKKPGEMGVLFDNIKQVATNSEFYKLKAKYPEIFSWYPNTKQLVQILGYLEDNKHTDASVYNLIRKELDWVMQYANTHGISQIVWSGSNLAECSTFMGKSELTGVIPLHIQRSIHSTTAICNEGSHRLTIDQLTETGKAPYLIKSTVLEFLNILYWLKDSPQTHDEINDMRTLISGKIKYENKSLEVEQDDKGNYHCGQCRLSYKVADKFKGQIVTLYDVTRNDSQSKDTYPYFAKFKVKNS